jgi:dUTP pyrophosphatase
MAFFKVKRLSPDARTPTKNDPSDAGIDIYTNEAYVLEPGEVHAFTTGISVEFPEGYVALIWDRSGLGVRGIHRLAGVIDSGYRGEWKIVLVNLSEKPHEVQAGDKLAQCVLQKFEPVEITEAEHLVQSARGGAGFGSSGR